MQEPSDMTWERSAANEGENPQGSALKQAGRTGLSGSDKHQDKHHRRTQQVHAYKGWSRSGAIYKSCRSAWAAATFEREGLQRLLCDSSRA